MDLAASPVTFGRAMRLMHFSLTGSLTLAGIAFVVIVRVQGLSLGVARDVGLILAGISVGLVAVASTLARRRMPERRFDQSSEDYWTNQDARGGAIVLWALIEAAGLVGWVGYLLTGVTAVAAAAVIAIGALVTFRPARLEREGA